MELRDQGMTWNEDGRIAGYDSFRRLEPLSEGQATNPPRLGRWQQVLANALDENVAVGVRATVTDNLGRAPTRAELTAARRAAHSLAVLGRARVLHVPGATWTPNTGSQLSGAGEAECDHERHSASRLAVSWRSRSWQQESSGHVLDHGIEFTHRCSGRIDEMGRHDLYSA
jgi:hypothetical protein